jgi:hypothetical protein
VADAAIGLAAVAASLYMIYVLEIVKMASPRLRRRVAERSEQTRRTA